MPIIDKEIQPVMVAILQDCVEDLKSIIKRQQIIIVLLVLLSFGLIGYILANQDNETMVMQNVSSQRDAIVSDGNKVNVFDKTNK
ncbi:MAG: hypothetical protein IJQ28_06965 [Clostridia bacterium]|nr:hypothetical protein [Clostridia bacterium]